MTGNQILSAQRHTLTKDGSRDLFPNRFDQCRGRGLDGSQCAESLFVIAALPEDGLRNFRLLGVWSELGNDEAMLEGDLTGKLHHVRTV